MAEADGEQVYQFKITLKGSKPRIWRRVLMPGEFTLGDLHGVIQSVMEWNGSHLWLFGGYGDDEQLDTDMKISEAFRYVKQKIHYIYDYGDNWDHIVLLEAIKQADPAESYPICVAGRQAAPPDDCGGIPGYYEMLKIINDPSNPEHDERWEWLRVIDCEDRFKPDYRFDAKSARVSVCSIC